MRLFQNLFVGAAILSAALFAACTKDSKTVEPQENNKPVINIADTTLEVASEGGDYTIELTVTNAIGDVAVVATCEAEWITIKERSNTFVKLTAAYNNDENARQASITIKYPEAESVVVEVTQLGKDGDPYTIEAKDVTYNSFVSEITAQNDEAYYVVYMSQKNYFEQMGITDEEGLLADDYSFFVQYAGAYGYELGEFMVEFGLARKGDNAIEWTTLVPDQDYVVYVYGVQFTEDMSDFTVTTPVFYEVVHTPINNIGEQAFDIEVAVDGVDASFTITPQGYDGYYATITCDDSSALYLAEGEPATDDYMVYVAQQWMTLMNSYMGYYDMTLEQVLSNECHQGVATFEESFYANVNYAILTFALEVIDGVPMLSSRPVVKTFETGDVAAADVTFDVEVNTCYSRILDFTVTPSNPNDGYTILVVKSASLEEFGSDEEIINYMVESYWLDEYRDAYHYRTTYLTPDTDYSILVFGYHGGVATTGLTRYAVKTDAEAPAEASVTNIVTYGPYDPVAIAELDPNQAYLANYAGYFAMIHWLETEGAEIAGVYHYIYDTASVEAYGDQWVFEDLVAYSYTDLMVDAGAFDTEHIIAAVVQDYRGNYSDMVYSEPFTYSASELRDAQEFVDIVNSPTRSGKVQVSLVDRKQISTMPAKR